MKKTIIAIIHRLIQKLGFNITRHSRNGLYPRDFSKQNIKICNSVKKYTMTCPERINALIDAVRYVAKNNIDGAMVECGVWKGGSTMAMAATLMELGDQSRDLYLYDTFTGMNEPGEMDISTEGISAHVEYDQNEKSDGTSNWCFSPLDEVKKNVFTTGYPNDKFHFIKGKVEDTIPQNLPKEIALLRLDTDWYESTKHELIHLFPLLKPKGILIIDDYGHWEGAKKAVDEYIADKEICIFLNRIDYSSRFAVKS